MRREGAPRWAGEADLRRAAKVTRLKNTPFCTQLAHIVGLQSSHAAPAPPGRTPLPAAAPPAVPPPPLVVRERELLSSWARVSSIDPEYRSKLAALVRTGPPGAPGTRAPRDAPAAAPPRVSPPPPPPRAAAAVAGEEEAAAKRGEQESALRASELRQLARMERVASLLKSEFRADLEQLLSIHSELIAHGISQARRESFNEPAAARAPPPPPAAAATAAPEPSRGVEARLRQMEETVHAQLERFAQQSAAQAAALQHVTQLLQANFSLGLSLQEQQGRTAAALYSLAQQRPPASAELATPPSPRGACEGEAALALARIEAMLREHSAALRQVACLQQKVAAREKGARRRTKRLKLRVGGAGSGVPPDGEERRVARACEGMEREAKPAGLEGGAAGREAPSVQEGVCGGMASARGARGGRASVRGGVATVREGRTTVREDASAVREGNLASREDPPAVRAVREDTVREATLAVRGGRASARGRRSSRRGRESAREGRASTREGTLSVRADASSEDLPAVREDTQAAHEAPPAVREAMPASLEGSPARVSTDALAASVRKAHEGSRPRRAAGQAAYEGARTGEEAQGGPRGGVEAVCGLCCERPMDAVMYRCGHQCACMQCAYFLLHNKAPCPICRAPVEDVIRVFQVR